MLKAVARILFYAESIHRHYFSFHGALPYKLAYVKARSQHKRRLTILCYPQVPRSIYVLYKLAHVTGCRITGNPKARHDLVVRFEDATYASTDRVLSRLAEGRDVVNARCTDISKKRVDAISTAIFGRSLRIDPLTYCGECLMKSDINSAKDGKIIKCPIAKAVPGYVYQRVVNNQMGRLVQDIRVPIIGGKIPFVYLIYERVKNRFFGNSVYVEMAETLDVLSFEEVKNLIRFCWEFGLDYGELDVLRDGENGFLYVVDANNTPTGPSRLLTKKERHDALSTLAGAFDNVFLSRVRSDVRSGETELNERIAVINEKKGGDSFGSKPKTVLQSQKMTSESRLGTNKLQNRIGICFALTGKSRGRGNSGRTNVNRLINFPVFFFLSATALVFLLSSWLNYLSIPRAMLESGKAIDRPAVQKAILINPNAVDLFAGPSGMKVPVVDQRVDFSGDTPLKEVMRKLLVGPSYAKDHVHSRFDVKTRHEARPAPNPTIRRSNYHPAGFFLGLEHQFAVFVLRLQSAGATGWFVRKDVLAVQTNGRWRKETPISQRRIRSWLTSSSRPARSMGLRARARKGRNRTARSLDATIFRGIWPKGRSERPGSGRITAALPQILFGGAVREPSGHG